MARKDTKLEKSVGTLMHDSESWRYIPFNEKRFAPHRDQVESH